MFKITDAEKLRDAYTLLAFIRDDVPTTTVEQKSGMAAGIGRNHFRGITKMVAGTNTAS